ncbi:MAG: N-acetyltransferase [Frankiales bacterium]|nr:N-acetyltransferase [Frankiales bacterium]
MADRQPADRQPADRQPADIRPAAPADATGIAAVYAPYVLTSVATFETEPPTVAVLRERMASGLPWLVACDGRDVVGFAYASAHHERPAYRWTVECTVYLADAGRGRGLGRALYGRLLPDLVARGLVTALARITLPNPASVALHEAMGFRPAGVMPQVGFKLGAWHDVGLWALRLVDPPPGSR